MVFLFKRELNVGQTAYGHKRKFRSTTAADAVVKGVNEANNGVHRSALGSGNASYFLQFRAIAAHYHQRSVFIPDSFES
jgi:hypothetical protein